MDDDTRAAELAEIRARIRDGSISDDELASRLGRLENRVALDDLQALCGKDGYTSWDETGTVRAHRSDGSVVKVLRSPGGGPLVIG